MAKTVQSFPYEQKPNKTRGVSHYGLAINIKRYLKGKRKITKTQIFHHTKAYNLEKNRLKETKIL
jgi:hypothetical protein